MVENNILNVLKLINFVLPRLSAFKDILFNHFEVNLVCLIVAKYLTTGSVALISEVAKTSDR